MIDATKVTIPQMMNIEQWGNAILQKQLCVCSYHHVFHWLQKSTPSVPFDDIILSF